MLSWGLTGGWVTGRAQDCWHHTLILFLPDELFQKVAEDYVSVAAFQVMTGVYFPKPLWRLPISSWPFAPFVTYLIPREWS